MSPIIHLDGRTVSSRKIYCKTCTSTIEVTQSLPMLAARPIFDDPTLGVRHRNMLLPLLAAAHDAGWSDIDDQSMGTCPQCKLAETEFAEIE